MKLEFGDLVVIRDESKFIEAVDSFHEKWASATVTMMGVAPAMAMARVMARATMMAMKTGTVMVVVMERKTGKSIELKYYGSNWKPFDQIVGIVTEVIQEDHRDFDVIKVREQSGGVRYCRRYILERARELS